jgi:hypothetical protein
MWTKIKWGLRILAVLIVGLFLHYTLPQRDIGRVITTYNRVTEIGGNWIFYSIEDTGTGAETTSTNRDIRFIDLAFPGAGNKTITYRNEDTGWFWPPYFKWDSSTLQAEATNLISSEAAPTWVAVTHYGWRLPLLSAFPNAVSVTAVSGPDVRLIPWLNIVILAFLLFALLMIRAMWRQFRERSVDPALDRAGDIWDSVDARADAASAEVKGLWSSITRWLGTWRAKPKK